MDPPVTPVLPTTRPSGARRVEYPYSDGRVLMDTEPHANSIVAMRNQLQTHFEARPNVYVAGSMAVYWQEGIPSSVVVPDVFVVLGVAKRDRRSYRVWDEGGVLPAFVVEVAPESAEKRGARENRATYESMGVPEYWRFDPLGKWIPSRLEGWRLGVSGYERVLEAGQAGYYPSEALGLELRAEGWLLRFRDPVQGRKLLTYSESCRAWQEAQRARKEANRRAKVEAAARASAEPERDEAKSASEQRDRAIALVERFKLERDEAHRRIRELEASLRVAE